MDMDIEAIRKQVEQQVMQYFHLEPTVTDAPYAGMVTGVDVISHLEHSLLNPDTTLETIERECAVARKYSVAAVCVAPYYVPAAREILLGSPVAVGTAIGFPHGCMSQAAKLAELRECMANGATEVDVALNVLAIKSGQVDDVDLFALPEDDRTQLAVLVSDIPDYACLVLVYADFKPDKRKKKLWDAMEKNAVLAEFAYQTERDLTAWIVRHFRAEKKNISPALCGYLLQRCGSSMTRLETAG